MAILATSPWTNSYEGEGDSFVPPKRTSVVDTMCLVVVEAPLMTFATSFMAPSGRPVASEVGPEVTKLPGMDTIGKVAVGEKRTG